MLRIDITFVGCPSKRYLSCKNVNKVKKYIKTIFSFGFSPLTDDICQIFIPKGKLTVSLFFFSFQHMSKVQNDLKCVNDLFSIEFENKCHCRRIYFSTYLWLWPIPILFQSQKFQGTHINFILGRTRENHLELTIKCQKKRFAFLHAFIVYFRV